MSTMAEKYVEDVAAARRSLNDAHTLVDTTVDACATFEVDTGHNQFKATFLEDGRLHLKQYSQIMYIGIQDMPSFIKWLQQTFVEQQ